MPRLSSPLSWPGVGCSPAAVTWAPVLQLDACCCSPQAGVLAFPCCTSSCSGWGSVRAPQHQCTGRQSRGPQANGQDGARSVEVPGPAKKRGGIVSALGLPLSLAQGRAAVPSPALPSTPCLARECGNQKRRVHSPTPHSCSAPNRASNLETPSPCFRVQTFPQLTRLPAGDRLEGAEACAQQAA